jgi:hypothetical protein
VQTELRVPVHPVPRNLLDTVDLRGIESSRWAGPNGSAPLGVVEGTR